jgi:acetyltransferase
VGRAILSNLTTFPGKVFAVSPTHREVLGHTCHRSVYSLPIVPDLAIIAIPASEVPRAIADCSTKGIAAAVVISAGFRENGPEGAALEHDMLAAAGRMRILGPNCLGAMVPKGGLNATFAGNMAHPGNIAFISQSGALCTAMLDWSLREGVGFSALISTGGMADIGWSDLIEHFGSDPRTRSIVCYMESLPDAHAFLQVSRRIAPRKPIVILKAGNTDAGARATASHTGAMTGSDAVFSAAFESAGILRVRNIEELFDIAEVLAHQPKPNGPRLGILTNAGGPAAIAADAAVSGGAQIAQLSHSTLQELDEFLPPQWSHGNPVDMLGAASGTAYGRAAAVLLGDENVDALLAILTPQAMTSPLESADSLAAVAARINKPVLASWMGGDAVAPARAALNRASIPTYDYPDAAAHAFGLMCEHSKLVSNLRQPPDDALTFDTGTAKELDSIRKSGRTTLTTLEAERILSTHGIPILESTAARSAAEAVRIADALGYPVAAKLWSERITHKARIGGVALNLRDAQEVRAAWHRIEHAARAQAGDNAFLGITIQRMAHQHGVEVILGSTTDSTFGPVVLFGAGGSLAEVISDRAFALPPLDTTSAARLIAKTRVHSVLSGKDGREALNVKALADVVARFSQIVTKTSLIAEIEMNPIVVSADSVIAIDSRATLQPAEQFTP